MALGTHENTSKTYLSIGYGKLRQRTLDNKSPVTETTPKAVKRVSESGKETWGLEYDFITGIIEFIKYKEDKEFGNSFELTIRDVVDVYNVSFKEDSRFWFDFAKKLPLVDFKKSLTITPYDFTDKEGKRRSGVSVLQNGVKLFSFYEKQENKVWVYQNGFPAPDSKLNWKDKDDLKVYMISVKKFLRNEITERILPLFEENPEHEKLKDVQSYDTINDELNQIREESINNEPNTDDLPF